MDEERERRAVPRYRLANRPGARVRGVQEVRLLDLSVAGAQIAHLATLRLGAACALELPPPGEACTLPAQVVWCTIVGRKRKLGGESHLVARSGLRFSALTDTQHAALTDTLHDLTTALQPIA
ncbi:MAG: hypothetical protein H6Q86_6058 [candidate division NC10 bacterium]|nr:hypothetical protein [candidate division NC10 bacterium]